MKVHQKHSTLLTVKWAFESTKDFGKNAWEQIQSIGLISTVEMSNCKFKER